MMYGSIHMLHWSREGCYELFACLEQQRGVSPYTKRPIVTELIKLDLQSQDIEILVKSCVDEYLLNKNRNISNDPMNRFFSTGDKEDTGACQGKYRPL